MHLDWPLALAGLGVGFTVGLTGMGGGALMTPLLVLVFKVPPLAAVSSDLVASVVMKPIGGGVHLRRGNVDMGLVVWLVLGSVPAAFLSVWALGHLADPGRVDKVVQNAVGAALVLASLGLMARGVFSNRTRSNDDLRDGSNHRCADAPGGGGTQTVRVRRAPTLAIGLFGGAMVGLTSVGSGSLMMLMLMIAYPYMSSRRLVGTDLVQAIPLVGAAAAGHLLFGQVHFEVTGALLVGAVPGVYLGARMSSRASDQVIRPILTVVLVSSGLKMLGVPMSILTPVALALATGAVLMIVRGTRSATRAQLDEATEAGAGSTVGGVGVTGTPGAPVGWEPG